MAAKTETIRARVSAKDKAQAERVFARLGLNASDAIRLFYKQVILHKGLPFRVAIPNAETRQAMQDIEEGRDLTRYDDFEEFRKQMLGE